jgi:hypothetical protein
MLTDLDLKDIADGDVRGTASDAKEMAQELIRLRAELSEGCECSDAIERTGQRMLALEVAAKDIWPLVNEVREIVADHYPDGSKHDDPEYERRRSVTAALVRQALDLRTVLDEPTEQSSTAQGDE